MIADPDMTGEIQKVAYQLQALVDAVKSLNEIQNNRGDEQDQPTFYSVETADEGEMRRFMKATDALLALNEIVNDSWQRSMIHHGGADRLTDKEGQVITPTDAMSRYRDHIFEILEAHGISLDEML
jgi:hypothetical protein